MDILFGEHFGDGHEIFSEGTSFIRANIVSATHGLAGLEVSDQVILIFHFSNGVGEGDGDGEGKTFGDGNDDDGDGDDEVLDDFVDGFDRDEVFNETAVGETVVDVVDEHGEESSGGREHTDLTDLFGQH